MDKVAITSPLRIQKILGCSVNVASKIVEEAQNMTEGNMEIKTADEIIAERLKRIKYIPTGVTALDHAIGGGIETDALTGFTGEFGCHDIETQVLTPEGIKNYKDVKNGDIIYGIDDNFAIKENKVKKVMFLMSKYICKLARNVK